MAFHIDSLAPVIALERAVEGKASALDAGQSREFALQSLVEGWDGGDSVAGSRGIEVEDVTVGGSDAEVLMLKVPEALGEQASTDQEHQRNGGLQHDERLLRQRRAVASGAVHTAQSFRGVGVGSDPRGDDSEDESGEQRQGESEA